MFSMNIADPEARRLAQQLQSITTATDKTLAERASKSKKTGSLSPAVKAHRDADNRNVEAPFGSLVVTQLQVCYIVAVHVRFI
jgi:hypothetical protein